MTNTYVEFDRNPFNNVVVGGQFVPEQFTFKLSNTAQAATTVLGNAAGATITPLNSAAGATVYIDSSSAQDAAAGSGAKKVRAWGINPSKHLCYEEVVPVGQTGTALENKFSQLLFMQVLSGAAAAGNIFLQDDATGTNKHLCIQATAVCSSMTNIILPDNILGTFELEGYSTIATTATDGYYVSQRKYILAAVTATTQFIVPSAVSVAANNTLSVKGSGTFSPGYRHDLYFDDIGSTAQTLNWALTLGLRYL